MAMRHLRSLLFATVLASGAGATRPAASAPAGGGLDAFVGRWQMNAGKTHMGRMGPNAANLRRSPTFTWQFTPQGPGLRMEVFAEYPQPRPTRTMTLITDAKSRPCESQGSCLTEPGDPRDQRYTYYPVNDHMLVRVFTVKGEVVEYGTYAVSKDGRTFTAISWSPETPEYQNIQVFDRQP